MVIFHSYVSLPEGKTTFRFTQGPFVWGRCHTSGEDKSGFVQDWDTPKNLRKKTSMKLDKLYLYIYIIYICVCVQRYFLIAIPIIFSYIPMIFHDIPYFPSFS